jgi:preprotein translocase subunit SecE
VVAVASDSSVSSKGQRTNPADFLRQVVAELRKVVWPTREQLITYFWVVLVFVLVVMTFVGLLDLGLGKLVFEIFA